VLKVHDDSFAAVTQVLPTAATEGQRATSFVDGNRVLDSVTPSRSREQLLPDDLFGARAPRDISVDELREVGGSVRDPYLARDGGGGFWGLSAGPLWRRSAFWIPCRRCSVDLAAPANCAIRSTRRSSAPSARTPARTAL
jgi:hypothetical protein